MKFSRHHHADWRKVMGVNLDGGFWVIKSLWPLLKESTAGRIINNFYYAPVLAAKASVPTVLQPST